MNEVPGPLPPNVHFDGRWNEGGIGRFAINTLPPIRGRGELLGGRLSPSSPQGALELAARFTPMAMRDGLLVTPGFVPPFGWERRSVVTVHDLMYLDPQISTTWRMRYVRRVLVPQLRRCRLVLTISDHSAAEVREVFGSKGPDVVNVGVGIAPDLMGESVVLTDDVPQLLFVGGSKRNKNLVRAFEAVARAQNSTAFECVVIGDVADSVAALAPRNTTIRGNVSDEELKGLYARSTALLMPSLGEGFGLPALESMVAGTPVVYGARGALPEVVGPLGWPVDPTDVASIASAIVTAIEEPIEISRAERARLVESHRWSDVAGRVYDAVVSVL